MIYSDKHEECDAVLIELHQNTVSISHVGDSPIYM